MKILSFSVNNLRGLTGGLTNNRVDFNGINTLFLFGKNNSGKSTFLKAYEYFYEEKKPSKDDYYMKNISNTIEYEIEVELDERDKSRIESAAPKAKDSYKHYLINDSKLRLKTQYTNSVKKALTWNPETEEYEEKGYATVGLHQVFQSCLPRPVVIKAMPTEEEGKSILNSILKDVAEAKLKESELKELEEAKEKIKELQDRMYNPDVIESYEASVNKHIEELFPDIRVSIGEEKDRHLWTENKLGREHDITFERIDSKGERVDSIPDSVDYIGHGTIRSAIFSLLLLRDIAEEFERVEGRKDYMVLFEEPELFLYPKVIRELRELIYKVSDGETPYQVLCASHSPSMIDITQTKSSIVRLVKSNDGTKVHQVSDSYLMDASGTQSVEDFKQSMYEVLRFNPYVCEAFYADHVILVEGPTEELIARAYFQEKQPHGFLYILNCGTVNNIPFYQKVLSKFSITYSIICDTDGVNINEHDEVGNPKFERGIQKSITDKFHEDIIQNGNNGILRYHHETFEPAHQIDDIPNILQMPDSTSNGKPYDANIYWKNYLQPNLSHEDIYKVPMLSHLYEIGSIVSA